MPRLVVLHLRMVTKSHLQELLRGKDGKDLFYPRLRMVLRSDRRIDGRKWLRCW